MGRAAASAAQASDRMPRIMSDPKTPSQADSAGAASGSAQDAPLVGELRELIVSSLNLQDVPGDVSAETELYGGGLGLDSIDILEVALVVSKRYGLQLRANDGNNVEIFRSLGSLAAYVAVHRTK
jgi:acyl carrier protein